MRVAALGAVAALTGCTTIGYYGQAVHGHFALMASARPVEAWIADPGTSDALRERLRLTQRIRAFASRELGLPDNASYTRYAELGRPAVVWNVFAVPELSLELRRWCYPVVGCATYRGYFARADADAMADRLRAEGLDVDVAGVPAYSTLGWFPDPLLSTFIHWPEGELARMIFHELAHQVAYARGDTRFNESFATAVEQIGVARWFAAHGDARARADYEAYDLRRRDFVALLAQHRALLEAVYASAEPPQAKRRAKRELFDALQRGYRRLRDERWGGYAGYDRYFARPLNGAHLAAVGTYNDLVPAFLALHARLGSDLPALFREVRRLADLPQGERDRALGAGDTLRAGAPAPAAGDAGARDGVGRRAAARSPGYSTGGVEPSATGPGL